MNKLKIYFTKDNSSATASAYAARRKENLIENLESLRSSLIAPFGLIFNLLWTLPQHILFGSKEDGQSLISFITSPILSILYWTFTTAYLLLLAPVTLALSLFNLSLFAVHKFFSLFASESKAACQPAPWKAPKVHFAKEVEVREFNPDSPLSETNDWSATTSFSEPAQ